MLAVCGFIQLELHDKALWKLLGVVVREAPGGGLMLAALLGV